MATRLARGFHSIHSMKTVKNGKTPKTSNEISSLPVKIYGFHSIIQPVLARVE